MSHKKDAHCLSGRHENYSKAKYILRLVGKGKHFFLLFTCWVIFHDFFGPQLTFSKKYFRNAIRVSNSLDTDQARHFVGLILVQTVLKYEQNTAKLAAARQRVKFFMPIMTDKGRKISVKSQDLTQTATLYGPHCFRKKAAPIV